MVGNGTTNNFTEFYKDCNVDLEGRKPFCRKIQTLGNYNLVLKIKKNNFEFSSVFYGDEERIIRSCGWMQTLSNFSCYKDDNQHRLETVCQCFTDGCNSAKTHFKNFTSVIVMVIVILMI